MGVWQLLISLPSSFSLFSLPPLSPAPSPHCACTRTPQPPKAPAGEPQPDATQVLGVPHGIAGEPKYPDFGVE